MENITLKQLAIKLGLSVATVSRALNDSYEISAKTKKKVHALAKELNYHPNPFASSLRKHKSKTIALIIPEISNNFFSQIIKGVEMVAKDKGYHVIICGSNENYEKEERIIKHLIGGRVDGILLSASTETGSAGHLQEIMDRNIPLILFDRVLEDLDVKSIVSNDYESSYSATKHLIANGCKKIAFLKVGNQLSNIEKRAKGYADALKENLAYTHPEIVMGMSNDEEENLKILSRFITEEEPDAIFAAVEHLAISVYDVCKLLNLKIPQDLKILTYSNLDIARHLNPSLTTISQPAYEMGKSAASLLLAQIENKPEFTDEKTLVIDSELIIRDSTS
jgi:LacI family transcriptional regulator